MRISESKVVQYIEASEPFCILVDDISGNEEKITREAVRGMQSRWSEPEIGTIPFGVGRIEVQPHEFPFFCFALGYFVANL